MHQVKHQTKFHSMHITPYFIFYNRASYSSNSALLAVIIADFRSTIYYWGIQISLHDIWCRIHWYDIAIARKWATVVYRHYTNSVKPIACSWKSCTVRATEFAQQALQQA